MTDIDSLTRVEREIRPVLLRHDAEELSSYLGELANTGLTVRVSRGRKMRRLPLMFDELAASLQFPLYFGENKDALNECLQDLEGLEVGSGIVLVWPEADQVLVDESESELGWLVETLRSAAEVWGASIEEGEWWDRPAVPFHLILVADPSTFDVARRRWDAAGAHFSSSVGETAEQRDA